MAPLHFMFFFNAFRGNRKENLSVIIFCLIGSPNLIYKSHFKLSFGRIAKIGTFYQNLGNKNVSLQVLYDFD